MFYFHYITLLLAVSTISSFFSSFFCKSMCFTTALTKLSLCFHQPLDKYPAWVYNINTLMGYLYFSRIPPRISGCEVWETMGTAAKTCACSARKKERSPEEIKKLIHRLNRIEGQIRGIRGMVEAGAYCPDILVQSSAVTAAVNAFNKELLASHIRTCVAQDIRSGKDDVIDELLATLQKLMK